MERALNSVKACMSSRLGPSTTALSDEPFRFDPRFLTFLRALLTHSSSPRSNSVLTLLLREHLATPIDEDFKSMTTFIAFVSPMRSGLSETRRTLGFTMGMVPNSRCLVYRPTLCT